MAVAGADHQLFALHGGAVTHAHDFQLAHEALAHPFHHVGDEGAAEAVALPGATVGAGGADHQGSLLLGNGDAVGEGAAEFALGALPGDRQPIEADVDLVGNGDRSLADA